MGKVYDALRRAEAQRAAQAGVPAATEPSDAAMGIPGVEPVESATEAAVRASAAPPRRQGFWSRFRTRKVGADATSASLNKSRMALLQPDSYVAEQFRTLRARIDSIAASHPESSIRTIAVTSALRGDGKTTAAIGLASVTAMSVGRKVLLVDADLRDPTVHKVLGLRVNAGLAEVLQGTATPDEAIHKVEGSDLEVLPVRAMPARPAELLGSPAMRELLNHLASRYDRVILDLPPALGLPDTKVVTELCDGVVFVVRADATPREDVNQALDLLDKRRILGLLLNGVDTDAARYDYRG